MTLTTLGYAFLGGLLPSFIWLYFLLNEDSNCPEPRAMIALSFVLGMAAVPLALPLELFAKSHLGNDLSLSVVTSWALIEEVLKYLMAALFILWRPSVDEPQDYVIYLITVALGFAAAENVLFLITPLSAGNFSLGFFTSDVRFLGSTLLHVVASSAIGFALAFSASFHPATRTLFAAFGLILAIALHTTFNAFIMGSGGSGATLTAFFLVWSATVVFFAAFEVLKYLRYRSIPKNIC